MELIVKHMDITEYKKYALKGQMKQEIFYKFGVGIFVLWEVYYSYWWLTIPQKIIKEL